MERMKRPVESKPQQKKECRDHDGPNDRVGGQHRSQDRTEHTPTLPHETPEQRDEYYSTLAPRSWMRLFGSRSFVPQRHKFTITDPKGGKDWSVPLLADRTRLAGTFIAFAFRD